MDPAARRLARLFCSARIGKDNRYGFGSMAEPGCRRQGTMERGVLASLACAVALAAAPWSGGARAAETSPASPLALELRETAEVWRNLQGGLSVGDTTLNKAQVSLRFSGDAVGWSGFSLYAQLFKTNAESLSLVRTGDVQTVSNIEAPDVTRLFELWLAQGFGQEDAAGWAQGRIGLIDLNRTFDSIDAAGLFINSSHGIGPDLSRSSATGPSIFPVSGLSAQADWRPTARLLAHVGLFGLPDPDRQGRLADARVSSRIGAVAIVQADYALAKDAQASVGVWRYTAAQPGVADPALRLEPRPGVYAFVEGPAPLPGGPNGWGRAGIADRRVQTVAGYVGAGLVWKGLVTGRPGDQFGLAVGRAIIGAPAREALGLPPAETTLEATYSLRLGRYLHLQPDVQHIFRPAAAPGLRDATVVGLRLTAFGRAPAAPDADD
jgi:porin